MGSTKQGRGGNNEVLGKCLVVSAAKSELTDITPELRERMKAEAARTGVGPYALLRGVRQSETHSPSAAIVSHWMHGRIVTGRLEHVDFVLGKWASLPDEGEIWIVATQEAIDVIRQELLRTGISQRKVLRGRNDLPPGLTFSKFEGFLNGKYKKFRKAHYAYILDLLVELQEPSDT
ncbi:MAG: hypothetical protein AAGB04_23555 [Pseudomonadota bacterium]